MRCEQVEDESWRLPVRGSAALACALFAGVFAVRLTDPSVGDGVSFLYAVPIVLLALASGVRGGLTGALLGCALVWLWALTPGHEPLSAVGYVDRCATFVALGLLLGAFVDRRRRREARVVSRYGGSLDERTRQLDEARSETLRVLARAAEYRDDGTSRHTERVGALAARIATELGLPDDEVQLLREAAPLHDVGKIAIADDVLLKPGILDAHEQRVMRGHTALGARLLENTSSPPLQLAAVIAASHHEWWDGSGYPAGASGAQIPLAGRIVAVADVFDALTHDRPYKKAWPLNQAIASIRRAAGTQFDPEVVAAFLAVVAEWASSPSAEGADEETVATRLRRPSVPDGTPMSQRSGRANP